jgi:hypothetical protein
MPSSVGVPGRRGARRPTGTFAEALLAVPPSGADPPAAAPRPANGVVLRSSQVEDNRPVAAAATRIEVPMAENPSRELLAWQLSPFKLGHPIALSQQ